MLIPVAAQSEPWVLGSSLVVTAGLNPSGGIDICLVCVVFCQVEFCASGWLLVQKSPTECSVSECDRECWIMRGLWPARGYCVMGKKWQIRVLYGIFSVRGRWIGTGVGVLCNWQGKTEVLRGKSIPLPHCALSHTDCPGIKPGSSQWQAEHRLGLYFISVINLRIRDQVPVWKTEHSYMLSSRFRVPTWCQKSLLCIDFPKCYTQ